MTKLNLEQMEADRKAGTPGEWLVRYDQGSTQLVMPDHPDMQCQMCDETYYPWVPDNVADWERIARVPQLEAMVSDMVKAVQMAVIAHAAGDPIDSLGKHVAALSDVLAKHVGEA